MKNGTRNLEHGTWNMTRTFLLLISIFYISVLSAQTVGTEIGDRAPEIRLPSPQGDTLALSSYQGKLVLIDFWGTWCAPCVQEQPELLKLYNKYKDARFSNGNGFEIFGVSLDSKMSSWTDMIARAGITWPQVSELKFWSSRVAKTYSLQELPYNLLVDEKGVIIAINLHGEELEKEIGKYLQSK